MGSKKLAVQDQNFVDCITDGSRPSTDGDSGLDVLQLLECVQISMREQRPVELTEVTQAKAAIPAQRLQFRD